MCGKCHLSACWHDNQQGKSRLQNKKQHQKEKTHYVSEMQTLMATFHDSRLKKNVKSGTKKVTIEEEWDDEAWHVSSCKSIRNALATMIVIRNWMPACVVEMCIGVRKQWLFDLLCQSHYFGLYVRTPFERRTPTI
jgi:hypothetical protein